MALSSIASKVFSPAEFFAKKQHELPKPLYKKLALLALAMILTATQAGAEIGSSSRAPASQNTCENQRDDFLAKAIGRYHAPSFPELDPQIEITAKHEISVTWNSGNANERRGFAANLDDSSCPVGNKLTVFPKDKSACAFTLTLTPGSSTDLPTASVVFKRECLPKAYINESNLISISRLQQIRTTDN